MIAALYVEEGGCYFGIEGVDPWPESRDARLYDGPWPVIAHPPCQRWGRYWGGSPRKPHQYQLGDDGGCFAAALAAVRKWGGVLEHPAHSHAWKAFALGTPNKNGGWSIADPFGGVVCHVEQGHYGHIARKPTWLYAFASFAVTHQLRWGKSPQRLPDYAIERYGYEKARRIGVMAAVGGKNKTKIRNATPVEFRDLLISIVTNGRVGVAAPAAANQGPAHQPGDDIGEGNESVVHASKVSVEQRECPSIVTTEEFFA